MVSDKPIRVAIVGLGFGAEFIPIYQNYSAQRCTPSAAGKERTGQCGDHYG